MIAKSGDRLRALFSLTDWAAKAALVIMACFVCLEVLSRSLFGVSTQASEEVASLALILLLFLGLPGAFADGALLRVQALPDQLRGPARRVADLLFHGAALAVTLVYLQQVGVTAWSSYEKGIVADSLLATPTFLPQLAMLAGLAALALVIVLRLGQAILGPGIPAAAESGDER